ncbi:hypothetical protein V2J09_004181 [Rumex salicifolius]
MLRRSSACTCGNGSRSIDEDRLLQLLMGLNDSYNQVRSNILMSKPVVKVYEAYSILIEEEKQRAISSSPSLEIDSSVMNAQGRPAQRSSQPPPTCSFCKKRGHALESCWQVHGKPDGYVAPKRVCTHCKKNGHYVERCYQLIGFPSTGKPTPKVASNAGTSVEPSSIPGLTPTQCATLFRLLNAGSSPSPDSSSGATAGITSSVLHLSMSALLEISFAEHMWILDSGATDHMCFVTSMFHSLLPLSTPYTISLPNGSSIRVTHHGSVTVLPGLTVHNVLFVPQFRFNLLSVRKLVSQTRCNILFTPETCLLQELSLRTRMVLGNHQHGLYLLQRPDLPPHTQTLPLSSNASTVSHSLTVCNDILAWHLRLGHVPFNKMKRRDKFAPRAESCVFLGFPFGQKAYRLLSTEFGQIIISRNVVFYDTIFPFSTPLPTSDHTPCLPTISPSTTVPTYPHTSSHSAPQDTSPAPQNTSPAPQPILPPPVPFAPRHSTRIRDPPAHLQDYDRVPPTALEEPFPPDINWPEPMDQEDLDLTT